MQRNRLLVGAVVGAILFGLALLLLPTWDALVPQVADSARDQVDEAIEAATEPGEEGERARLRLELAQLEQEDARRQSELRTTIAQVGTVLLAAWAAITAWRQLQDNRRQAGAAQRNSVRQLRLAQQELKLTGERTAEELRLSREELALNRRGQVTERFTRAVDQLGNVDNMDVRLGGIYALEHIARDSEEDRVTIAEVLTAFVRAPAQRARAVIRPRSAESDSPTPEEPPLFERAADVQAAMTVLGRMPRDPDARGLDLSASELPYANLRQANLVHTNFTKANLSGSLLFEANLDHAVLREADLTGAILSNASLISANLILADLTDAKLMGANLTRAFLINTKLVAVNFKMATLTSAIMHLANLTNAELSDASLRGASFDRAKLIGADLRGAVLTRALLTNADLTDADLTAADLTEAKANSNTRWPDGFDFSAAGVITVSHNE